MPHPERQHHVRGHPHHRKPGVLHGQEQTGGASLLHRGGSVHGAEGGPGEHLFRRGTHGRENAPSPPVLHAYHGGRAAVRQGDFRQPGAAFQVAGRVSRPHEKGVPRPQTGRERPCYQAQAHPHMAVQAVRRPHKTATGHRKGHFGNWGAERREEARRGFGDGGAVLLPAGKAFGADEEVPGYHRLSDAGERGPAGKGQQRKEHTEADGGAYAEKGKRTASAVCEQHTARGQTGTQRTATGPAAAQRPPAVNFQKHGGTFGKKKKADKQHRYSPAQD